MSKQITFAICGFGSRGGGVYAGFQKKHPDLMKVVAVADPRPERLQSAKDDFGVAPENCFDDGFKLLEQPRLADVLVIATQDKDHIKFAIPALKKGYDLLLEKPISPSLDECLELQRVAHEYNRTVVVCHVLRYTPFYGKLKELIDSGVVGEIKSIIANEGVGYWHFAHSYVRGNWRRAADSSPVIMAKSCHDLDIIRWLVGKPCVSLTSFGSLDYFKASCAPEGAAERCLDGCKCKDDCPYDCEKIYMEHVTRGYNSGNRGWPLKVLTHNPTEESLYKAMKEGPYGRCVFHCDNDVCDHQIVNMIFENNVTVSFTLNAFTQYMDRDIKILGTLGEITGDMDEGIVNIRRFGKPDETIKIDMSDTEFGHAGGDAGLMNDLCSLMMSEDRSSRSSIDASIESHVMALAAEESRLNGGKPIVLKEFVKR